MDIQAGQIFGKHSGSKVLMYSVLKVTGHFITLQNVDNPLSLFETTAEKLEHSGYECISHTPYIAAEKSTRRRKAKSRPKRCPHTIDLFEGRTDSEKPVFAS